MARYTKINKFSKKVQQELFLLLVDALSGIRKSDAAKLLRDLLSEQEAVMLARRLKIALLLEEGLSYEKICREIPVSHGTIAKIQLWLKTYGDGFRLAIPKIKLRKDNKVTEEQKLSWRQVKKRYPIYFWPELLLQEIVKSASQKERKRLVAILGEMHDKTPLTKQLQNILNQKSNTM